MHIGLISQYFWPEDVGPAVFLRQLAEDLVARGHRVTVITAFPNYPEGKVFEPYRGKLFAREQLGDIEIIRTYIFATQSKKFWKRVLNFGSFCASSFLGALRVRADVFYCVIPPLPLAVSAIASARLHGAAVVTNVQDIYPEIAVRLGYLKNPKAIRLFERMERWIYAHSDAIVVISDAFRDNLLEKGVPAERLRVVANWADAEDIKPAARQNGFRAEHGLGEDFTFVYSGTLSHNSAIEQAFEAVRILQDESFKFVFVGEGVHKSRMVEQAKRENLCNIRFLPFQPWDRYSEVLAASDVQLVSLNSAAGNLSLPSKLLKIMAAARPALVQAPRGSELASLVEEADCGITVDPDDPVQFAEAARKLAAAPQQGERMGRNGREFFLRNFERRACTSAIGDLLEATAGHDR